MERMRVLLILILLIILVDMASGAGDSKDTVKETIVNVGKTFSHIAKFKEGSFGIWIMSITVTLCNGYGSPRT